MRQIGLAFLALCLIASAALAQLGPMTSAPAAAGTSTQYQYNATGSMAGSPCLSTSGTVDTDGCPFNFTAGVQQNGTVVPVAPGGRLTLTSTAPVMNANVAAGSGTAIYYEPYNASIVAPNYNGTNWLALSISGGLTLTLNSTDMPTTEMFDVYLLNVSGTPTLCAMYWGGNSARSTTAGGKSGSANASITQLNGVWVNNAAIASSNCYNSTTSYAISQNQGTLLGSFYTAAAGETEWECKQASASGGNIVAIDFGNAYNLVSVDCSSLDSNTAKTGSTSWAQLGTNDTVSWVDSLQQVSVRLSGHVVGGDNSAAADCAYWGAAVGGSGTGTPLEFAASCAANTTLNDVYQTMAFNEGFLPILGYSIAYAEIDASAGTPTYMKTAGEEDFTISLSY